MANVSPIASVLILILAMFPAPGSADTVLTFSDSGPSTGTISGDTVSGITFNAITYNSQIYTVNNFVEAYSNDVLTFSVVGGGSLASTGLFSNISGTFITMDEETFGTNPQVVNLLTVVTDLNVSTALLGDLNLDPVPGLVILNPSTTVIAAITQANGNVISSEASLAFQGPEVPEASTLSMLGVGLLGLGWLGIRPGKERAAQKK